MPRGSWEGTLELPLARQAGLKKHDKALTIGSGTRQDTHTGHLYACTCVDICEYVLGARGSRG